MTANIDLIWILINSPIIGYFSKNEIIELSLINKNIRNKLLPTIFNQLEIDKNVIKRHSEYFNQWAFQKFFKDLSPSESKKLNNEHRYNKGQIYKQACVDRFIEETNTTLKLVSINCKSL
jgi:hypothetical protein